MRHSVIQLKKIQYNDAPAIIREIKGASQITLYKEPDLENFGDGLHICALSLRLQHLNCLNTYIS